VPAKINLHLSVGPVRADGFHELVTVFHAVDLYDEVTASAADELRLTITGDGAAELPTDERNLAWRAADLLARSAHRPPAVDLRLHKRIPLAGGMAGGSADAAATLVACSRVWQIDADLVALAAGLGSDVAFPLVGGTAVGTGRGERLSAVPSHGPLHWAIALADGGISAAAAYRELDRLRSVGDAPSPAGSPDRLLAALGADDPRAVAGCLANDLQAAALSLRPDLQDVLDAGATAGALAGVVSGSGPTCVFLCADAVAADAVAGALRSAGVCRDACTATGPAPGAADDSAGSAGSAGSEVP
jgi:4-diphosphocytidyl-2-C-methyl-D-erythritol kinase